MLSNFIIRSTAAVGGAPFRFNECTALIGGALGLAGSLVGGLLVNATAIPAAAAAAVVRAMKLSNSAFIPYIGKTPFLRVEQGCH